MRKSDLQFVHSTLFMKQLLVEPSMNKTAQSFFSGIYSDIKNKITGLKSAEEVLAFLTPGAFWTLGFRKLAIIYMVAEAFGFDFAHFFGSLRIGLKSFVEGLFKGEQGNTDIINDIVEKSASESFTNNIDPEKAKVIMDEPIEKFESINDILMTQKIVLGFGKRTDNDAFLYRKFKELAESATGTKYRKGLLSIIVKVFSWILSVIFYSLGFTIIGSVASKILGAHKNKDQSKEDIRDGTETTTTNTLNTKKNVVLHLNPNADPHLSTTTYNDNNHVWLLNMNVNNIRDMLIKWAQELYQQLTDKSAFEKSESFNRTLKMFQDRNKTSTQLEIMAVPQPFTSIKQIVDSFAADVAAHMS